MSNTQKKLEEIFQNVNYISPSQNEYKIIIKDEKIRNIIINNFHVVSSYHYIFIIMNENLPIFKLNLEKNIKIKEYHSDIKGDVMEIIIIEYNINDQLIKFQKKNLQKYFFKFVLNNINQEKNDYNKTNDFYLKNLKKKAFNILQLYYLNSLKEKISTNKLRNKIAFLKLKELLKNIHNEKEKKEKTKKEIDKVKFYLNARLFLNILNNQIKKKKLKQKQIILADAIHNKKLLIQSFKGLKNTINTMEKFTFYSDSYYITHLKEIIFNVLKNNKNEKKRYKSIIQKYNKMNFLFLEYIAQKLGYNEYLNEIYNERIKQIFGILKTNYLKAQIVSAKFNLLSKKILNKNLENQFKNIKRIKNYQKKLRNKLYQLFFMKVTNFIYNKKIIVNKQLLLKISNKQNIYQEFLTNIANNLSNKFKNVQLNAKWNKKQGKFRLYEFFLNLFKLKKLDEVKLNKINQNSNRNYNKNNINNNNINNNINNNKGNIKNSFEIFSKSNLLKNKKNQIKLIQLKNFFMKFLHLIKFSRQNSLLNEEKRLLKKANNQNQSKIFLKNIKKDLDEKKKINYFIKKIYDQFFNKIKQKIIYKKFDKAGEKSHNFQLKKNSFIVLKHYNNFKKEKKTRNIYFNYKLQKLLKKHLIKKYLINLSLFLNNNKILSDNLKKKECINAIKTMKKTIKDKKAFNLIRSNLKKDYIKKILIASFEKIKFNKLLQLFNSKVKKSKINENLIKPILNKYEINNDLKNKIRCFNLTQILLCLVNNLESNKSLNISKKKFYFKNFKNKCLFDKIKKRDDLNKKIKLNIKLFFPKLKNLLDNKKKEKVLKNKYVGLIIKKYISKFAKCSKLFKSLFPFPRNWKIIWFYYIKKQLILIKSSNTIRDNIIKNNKNIFIKTLIKRNLKRKANKKMINIFQKKQNLKNFMISILNQIRINIYKKKLKEILCRKFFAKFNSNNSINFKKKQNIKKTLKEIQNYKLIEMYKIFLIQLNKLIYKKIIDENIIIYNSQKQQKTIKQFLDKLIFIKNKNKVKKKFMKMYFKTFISNILLNSKSLNDKIFSYIIINAFKQFSQNSFFLIQKRDLNELKEKFIYQKNFLKFINNILSKKENKKWKEEINQRKLNNHNNDLKNKILKNAFKEFRLQIQIEKKLNYKLKRKIFNYLKKNVEKVKDVNFYLDEAKNFPS